MGMIIRIAGVPEEHVAEIEAYVDPENIENITRHHAKGLFTIDITTLEDLTPAEQSQIKRKATARRADWDFTVGEAPLDVHKAAKISEIDKRTHELIEEGYTYDEKVFSSSENAQRKMAILAEDADNLSFPIDVAQKDDLFPPYSVVDKATLLSLFSFFRNHIQTQLYSGEDLKDDVRAATDIAGVNAIEDPR